jgi:hypothetical protein
MELFLTQRSQRIFYRGMDGEEAFLALSLGLVNIASKELNAKNFSARYG